METDNNKLERIREKLRKLLDLKESALQCGEVGEANAAAAGITRLLTEYDLTLQDIPDSKKVLDPIDIDVVPFKFRYTQFSWYWDLMDVVAEHNNADIFRTRYKSGTRKGETEYSVVGRKNNREVVLYLISFLAEKFINLGRSSFPGWKLDYIRSTGRIPPSLAVYMKSYLMGCVIGLNDKLEKERQQFDTEKINALVKTEKAAIEAFMNDNGVTEARRRNPELMDEVVRDGIITGKNVQINQGIGNHGKPVRALQ